MFGTDQMISGIIPDNVLRKELFSCMQLFDVRSSNAKSYAYSSVAIDFAAYYA